MSSSCTVNPGFGGQSLIEACIPKIAAIKKNYPDLPIAVDGGVNEQTIGRLAQAGASTFITGAGLFSSTDYKKTIKVLRAHALPQSKKSPYFVGWAKAAGGLFQIGVRA